MNSQSHFKRILFLFTVTAVWMAFGPFDTVIEGKEGYIKQCEFAGALFDRLEIAPKDIVLTKEQKIRALEELRFAPEEGYIIGELMLRDGLITVLIRIYELEKDLPADYTLEDALNLLIEKNILKEEDRLETHVTYDRAVQIIFMIEPIPHIRPGLILLPRVPIGPDTSPTE